MATTTQQPTTTEQPAAAPATTSSGGGGDALDQGVDKALTSSGHKQKGSTVEKISDGIRKLFKKGTGKDVPIKDKEMK